eukprot:jgi/Tetstr1/443358/TSEL_031373.t1
MPGNDTGQGSEHAAGTGSSTVSPAGFAELEALLGGKSRGFAARLSRDDPQRTDGTTTSEPRPPAAHLALFARRPAPAPVTYVRPLPSDGDNLTWKDWTPLIAPGFAIQPAPGLSTTPDFHDIAADETSRILTEKRHKATLDQYRLLYCDGFYDAVAHAALNEAAAAAIEGAASQESPPPPPRPVCGVH